MADYLLIFKLIIPTMLCVVKLGNGFRTFTTEIDAMRYEHNPDIVQHIHMELKEDSGRNKLNGLFSFVQDFDDLAIINWVTLRMPNGRSPTIYNLTIGACKFLDNTATNLNPIFASILQILKKYIYLPSECPLKKDTAYAVRGIYFDEDLMPPYIPQNNFTGVIGVIRNKTFGFKITLKARIISKSMEKKTQTKKLNETLKPMEAPTVII